MAEILIVAATERELAPFLAGHGIAVGESVSLGGHRVVVETTGVGVVAATYNIKRLVDVYRPDFVVQAGICGAYPGSGLEVGECVVVGGETLADLGVVYEDGLRPVFGEGLTLENPAELGVCGMKTVRGNTVSAACAPYVGGTWAAVESMEGYALFFVCLREGVRFAELRSVSNVVSTDRSSWDMGLATERLAERLTRFIEYCG